MLLQAESELRSLDEVKQLIRTRPCPTPPPKMSMQTGSSFRRIYPEVPQSISQFAHALTQRLTPRSGPGSPFGSEAHLIFLHHENLHPSRPQNHFLYFD
jgi:hypothetical protein